LICIIIDFLEDLEKTISLGTKLRLLDGVVFMTDWIPWIFDELGQELMDEMEQEGLQ